MDKPARDLIGREMRKRYDLLPKGPIPDRIWRLLLALEHVQSVRAAVPGLG